MKDLIIIGAGDFGREAIWVAERMNAVSPTWNILGFADDGKVGENIDGYPVIGDIRWLKVYAKEVYASCAISRGKIKEKIWDKLSGNLNIKEASLIDPAAIIGRNCHVGEGCIICAGTVLTVDVKLGKNCILNLNCTVGHDAIINDFCTIQPGSNISGKVILGKRCEVGTGTKIIQRVEVSEDVILGAGSVVIKNISQNGTYVGSPVRKVK